MVWSITKKCPALQSHHLTDEDHPSTNTALTLFASNPDTCRGLLPKWPLGGIAILHREKSLLRSQWEVGPQVLSFEGRRIQWNFEPMRNHAENFLSYRLRWGELGTLESNFTLWLLLSRVYTSRITVVRLDCEVGQSIGTFQLGVHLGAPWA